MKNIFLTATGLLVFFLCGTNKAGAQRIIGYDVVDGDSIPIYELPEVDYSKMVDSVERKRFELLVHNIKMALPYAKMAAFRLQLMEDNLRQLKGKERKEYLKASEKAFKDEFTGYLKNMPRSRGILLTKLIYRETGKTVYEILDAFTGGFETFLWNTTASVMGGDLKDTFDPEEDYQVERVIKSLGLE